ncbi:hypothetical protein HDE76_000057 [Rhodanobacter sp. ANJX3]|uniref:hypothetical protein n=1 Tax=Rhodanobacter sp. ANJX3 TaxID=2723083 RepID=UPI0016097EE1|nr:hypothetical protein [Rhodanobacter sp. ANJX3]MBB5356875.1 hypothetical protein [Rhodanobacter sp. ANJX3]
MATPTSAPLLSDDAAALSEPPRPPEQAASENAKPIVAMPISNVCAFTVSTFQLISGRLHRCSADRSALSGCGTVRRPGNRRPVFLVIIEASLPSRCINGWLPTAAATLFHRPSLAPLGGRSAQHFDRLSMDGMFFTATRIIAYLV